MCCSYMATTTHNKLPHFSHFCILPFGQTLLYGQFWNMDYHDYCWPYFALLGCKQTETTFDEGFSVKRVVKYLKNVRKLLGSFKKQ